MGRRALTMLELLVVLVILIALAGIAVPLVGESRADANLKVTTANMNALRDVILGAFRADMTEVILDPYRGQPPAVVRPLVLPRPGSFGLNAGRHDHPQLRYLFVNPGTFIPPGVRESTVPSYDPVAGRGWRGPYILPGVGKYPATTGPYFTRDFGEMDDPTVLDGWGRPIVIVEVVGSTGLGAVLRSAGSDGKLGTTDDIDLVLY